MKYYTQANRFLQKYGSDAFKIIAAYEEAADIPPTERYANWYGDTKIDGVDIGIFFHHLPQHLISHTASRGITVPLPVFLV